MSKRKLTSEEALANILRFVETDDNNNYFEGDWEDELGWAGDDLDEIYDYDDRNADDEDSGDDDEDEVEDKCSSDNDQLQPQPQPQPGNQPPRKLLTYNRLVKSIDKSLDPNCFDPLDFGIIDAEEHETVLKGYLSPKKNPATETIFWSNKKRRSTKKLRYFATESSTVKVFTTCIWNWKHKRCFSYLVHRWNDWTCYQ